MCSYNYDSFDGTLQITYTSFTTSSSFLNHQICFTKSDWMLDGLVCTSTFTFTVENCAYTSVSVSNMIAIAGELSRFDFGDIRKRICDSDFCFIVDNAKL